MLHQLHLLAGVWAGRQPAGVLPRHCGAHGARPHGQRPQQRHDGLRGLRRRQDLHHGGEASLTIMVVFRVPKVR